LLTPYIVFLCYIFALSDIRMNLDTDAIRPPALWRLLISTGVLNLPGFPQKRMLDSRTVSESVESVHQHHLHLSLADKFQMITRSDKHSSF